MRETERFIKAISEVVWGAPMLILVVGCGVYLTFRLGFFQITQLRFWTRETFGALFRREERKKGGITPCQAVSSALASSIGTGNIVGVATAIASGGAGAVFWMWISAFFGMAVKYAEIFLAVKFRDESGGKYRGGPMVYIEKGMGKGYKWLGILFSVSGAVACLGMGAMSQSNSIAEVAKLGAGVPGWMCGSVLAVIAAFAVCGGITRVTKITQVLVPFMAMMYILGGLAVAVIAPASAASAVRQIFSSALAPKAVYGSLAGEAVRRAVRVGVSRGVFSNEAGLGSAPIVHAAAETKSPVYQGLWGVFEVFVDTVIVCSITAIVILSAGCPKKGVTGAELVAVSFSKFFGAFGGVFVGVATVLFALSTILGWSYYGERCVAYLTNENALACRAYKILFVLAVMLGALICVESVWALADLFNGVMMVPNLIAVISLSGIVIRETKKCFRL